jgi:hypothetical protein
MSESDDVFGDGDSNYGGGDFFKVWKLRLPDEKKGETETRIVRRLFPAMKSYREDGSLRYFQYIAVHYGYEGVSPRDPSKRRARPFFCPFRDERDSGLVLEPCEKCDDVEEHKASHENAKAGYLKDGRSKESTKALLKPFVDWERKHNRDGKYYFLGMDPATEDMGVLMLTPKCKNKLLKKIDEHRKRYPKLDPLKPKEGVLFEFVRTGQGFEINDEVSIVEEERLVKTEEGTETVFRPKPAPLTAEQIKKAGKVCPDLNPAKQQIAKILTHEQIKMLVACSGDPEEVDNIWNLGQPAGGQKRRRRTDDDNDAGGEEEAKGEMGEEVPKPAPKEPAPAAEPEESEEDREIRLAEEKLAAAKAARAAAKQPPKAEAKPAPKAAPKAAPAPDDMSGLSDDEFLEKFGG